MGKQFYPITVDAAHSDRLRQPITRRHEGGKWAGHLRSIYKGKGAGSFTTVDAVVLMRIDLFVYEIDKKTTEPELIRDLGLVAFAAPPIESPRKERLDPF